MEKTKIFLDGGDPEETKEVIKKLGFLDGQTTNPTLISKNPLAQERLLKGEKFLAEEILEFYKSVVKEISTLIPQGSVSVEVYADQNTTYQEMFEQGKEMFTWIPNAHIKYPTNKAGLEAAERSIKEGMRVNMTLAFKQEQAAAIYAATKGAKKGDVFVSPFIGRLDDLGQNGMDIIANILKMYTRSDSHVEVLAASIRSMAHFEQALKLGSDIITAPIKILNDWQKTYETSESFNYDSSSLKPIPYETIDLSRNWQEYNIEHELTTKGVDRFAQDWNSLIK